MYVKYSDFFKIFPINSLLKRTVTSNFTHRKLQKLYEIMKTCYHLIRLFLCLGFALLFSCCSSDEFTLTEENNTLVQRQNIANSYEQTGILYSQIYHEYQLIHSDSSYSINRIIIEVEKIIELSTIYNVSIEVYY